MLHLLGSFVFMECESRNKPIHGIASITEAFGLHVGLLAGGSGAVSDSFIGVWDHIAHAGSFYSALICGAVLSLTATQYAIFCWYILFPKQKWRVYWGWEQKGNAGMRRGRGNYLRCKVNKFTHILLKVVWKWDDLIVCICKILR